MATRDEMARSFGGAAGDYEAGRPGYPADAVRFLLDGLGEHPRVADVGAGTGKLTRTLVDLGADAVAVDPDAGMLRALQTALPGVPAFVGTAEQLPLDDASADALVFGQAWHWVRVAEACAEAGRVLRPGGSLGLIWNLRDESVPWVARMTAIMHPSSAEQMLADEGPEIAAPFTRPETRTFGWRRRMTRQQLFAMVRSRSYIITAEPAERARIESELGGLFDEIGAVDAETVELPYVTKAFRARREAGSEPSVS
ncbi:SAM-dependent methyltransferase [Microbacterium mangrovi]|uniref:SAM-dependent methyltransferase n=1 Tax=Microbacterium mangrovi TaxID=1348253 RepID=A0A0B2A4N3_9MICO|nr:class I SAM-dependent methyltransferase [Microbacterium mangrovi]KHK98449.1 SAM-dependent methyltransferase [Microbacterium mangrovi]